MRLQAWWILLFLPLSSIAGECPALLNHQFRTLQGGQINMCEHQAKTIVVVNTASKCGFTPQFEKLEKLYSQYQDRGLIVVGFPSNDFRQELKSNSEIGSFCKLTYKVKFPMAESGSVTGTKANSFYKQLKQVTGQEPQWNFHKYVITEAGRKVSAFPSVVEPDDPQIMQLILNSLKK